jgi:hypothetical protein
LQTSIRIFARTLSFLVQSIVAELRIMSDRHLGQQPQLLMRAIGSLAEPFSVSAS